MSDWGMDFGSALVCMCDIMSFNRVPEGFMEGVFIAPHSFSDPENPQHGEYVHLQLRNDLYYSTLE